MNHDVFISYSSQNREAAQAICHVLEQNEIRCWIAPRDIPGGAQYGDIIEDAIKICKVVVVLFSKTAAVSPWVSGELNVAFEEQKTIIPLRLDQTPLKGQNRVMLNQRHWIDAYPDYKTKFSDLVSAVSQAIGREVKQSSAPASTPDIASASAPVRPAAPSASAGAQGPRRQYGGPVELTYGPTANRRVAPSQPGMAPRPLGANGRPLASATPRQHSMAPRQQAAAPVQQSVSPVQQSTAPVLHSAAPRSVTPQNYQRPAYQSAAQPPQQKGIAKWKIIAPIAAGVVLLVVLILVFVGGGSSAGEQEAQANYLQKVEECRAALTAADNFTELEEAAEGLSEIESLERRYREAMPSVFNQYESLVSHYEEMQQKQRREYIEIAENFKSRGDYRTAYDHYEGAAKALPDDEELQRLVRQMQPELGYIYVNDVEYSNSEADGSDIDEAGSTLYANRMRYLFPKVVYNSLLPSGHENIRLNLTYKLIKPDGTLDRGSGSPDGYTATGSFLVAHGERNQGEWLKGWGNADRSTFEAGTYTFKLYYQDHQIYEETFELH